MAQIWSEIAIIYLKTNQEIYEMKCKQDTCLPIYPLLLSFFYQSESIFNLGECPVGNLRKLWRKIKPD